MQPKSLRLARPIATLAVSLAAFMLFAGVAHAGAFVLVNGDIVYPTALPPSAPTTECSNNGGSIDPDDVTVNKFHFDVLYSVTNSKASIPSAFATPCGHVNQPCFPSGFDAPTITTSAGVTTISWTNASAFSTIRRGRGYHFGYNFYVTPGPAPIDPTPTPNITHKVSGTYTLKGGGTCQALPELTITKIHSGNELSLSDIFAPRVLAAPPAQTAESTQATPALAGLGEFDDVGRSFYVIRRFTNQDLKLEDLSVANPEFASNSSTVTTTFISKNFFPNDQPPHQINFGSTIPDDLQDFHQSEWKWEVLEVRVDVPNAESPDEWSSRLFIAMETDSERPWPWARLGLIIIAGGIAIGLWMYARSRVTLSQSEIG